MMPAIKTTFDLMGDDIVELSTENDASENKIGSHVEKWLEKFIAKLFKKIHDEKKINLIMTRMQKRIENIK